MFMLKEFWEREKDGECVKKVQLFGYICSQTSGIDQKGWPMEPCTRYGVHRALRTSTIKSGLPNQWRASLATFPGYQSWLDFFQTFKLQSQAYESRQQLRAAVGSTQPLRRIIIAPINDDNGRRDMVEEAKHGYTYPLQSPVIEIHTKSSVINWHLQAIYN